MSDSTTDLFVEENNEEFRTGTYNDISIIFRATDKYVNVSKLCIKANKSFYDFKRGKKWQQIIQYWNENEGIGNLRPLYELHKNYNKAQGIYVHPDLIHFVAEWISIEYAFKVKRIMDLINERNKIENKSLDDTINELQDTITILKNELAEKDKTIDQKTKHIVKTSVPEKNCEKKFHILVLRDNYIAVDEQEYTYKISADSSNSDGKILRKHNAEYIDRKFIAPASMNLKQLFHNKFGCGYYFNDDRYDEVINFINSNNIKEVV